MGKERKAPTSVCVLCGEPWEPLVKNRCECGGFCTWGPAKGFDPSSWERTENGWIPKRPLAGADPLSRAAAAGCIGSLLMILALVLIRYEVVRFVFALPWLVAGGTLVLSALIAGVTHIRNEP